jgi:hypothetical protein
MPDGTSTPIISGRNCALFSTCSGGMHAGLEDLLLVVDVVEEGVERLHPLPQAGLQRLPLGRRDDARDDVEGDQALGAGLLAVDREGDADAVKRPDRTSRCRSLRS